MEEEKKKKYWIGVYALAIVGFLLLHYLLDLSLFAKIDNFLNLSLFERIDTFIPFLQNFSFTLSVVAFILLIRTVLERLIDKLDQPQGDRYNLKRVCRLVANVILVIFVLTSLFNNPYKSLTGLGLVSLVLGFALQAPITSFIAWLYVILRRPYKVGDRIQISDHRGDVIEISYLDTTIMECSGDYLGNDRLSGRLIHFPNSKILTDRIINYHGPQVPFIWNETAIQIAYTSDLNFVEKCLKEATSMDFREKYPHQSVISHGKWDPEVYFRSSPYAWMEAVVSYPVEPTDTTGRRNRILRRALPMLNENPSQVQFPEGTLR